MPEFKQNGFHLEYPKEWELEFDEEKNIHELTLYSPNGAFWSLTRRPGYVEPDDLLKESVEALTAEYAEAEVSTAMEEYHSRRLDGFDIDFFYLDLPCMAMVRAIRFGIYTYLVYIQTMDQSADMLSEIQGISRFWTEHLEMIDF